LKEKGEEELLRVEENLALGIDYANTLFSPGGSIVYSQKAMEKLREETTVMHLDVPFDEIRRRIMNHIDTRGVVGLEKHGLEGLYQERVPRYREFAHYTIPCANMNEEKIVEQIYAILQHI